MGKCQLTAGLLRGDGLPLSAIVIALRGAISLGDVVKVIDYLKCMDRLRWLIRDIDYWVLLYFRIVDFLWWILSDLLNVSIPVTSSGNKLLLGTVLSETK